MLTQTTISISQSAIGGLNQPSVSGRDLHSALEISKDFSNWIKNQIARAQLREGVDFATHALKGERRENRNEAPDNHWFALKGGSSFGGDRRSIDYLLTLDAAKHIAMMSQSQKAKAIRDYFIAVEKEWRIGACPLLRGACGGAETGETAKMEAYNEMLAKLSELEKLTHNAMANAISAHSAVRGLLGANAKLKLQGVKNDKRSVRQMQSAN